jgi:S-DNA-T family DNA segregation ATPase FtsK/SpoIIIE
LSGRGRSRVRRAPAHRGRKLIGRAIDGLADILGSQSHDLWGLVFLLFSGLAALGIWFNLTGPFGRLAKEGSGDAFGVGRLFVPFALAGIGVAQIRGRRSERPVAGRPEPVRHDAARVAIGFGILGAAVCGLFDLINGPAGSTGPLAQLRHAGGFVGGLVGGPLRAGVSGSGATLVLLTLIVLAALVITRTPLHAVPGHLLSLARAEKEILQSAGHFVGGVATLSLGRSRRDERGREKQRHPTGHDVYPPRVTVFDQAEYDGDEATDRRARGPKAGRGEAETTGDEAGDSAGTPRVAAAAAAGAAAATGVPGPAGRDAEQLSIELGPAVQPGEWRLPPLALLKRTRAAEIDRRFVEAAGQTLENSLAAHGVETRLVGMTVGPTVTRYELELGPGVKVARVTSLNKDIAYAMAASDVRILAPIPGRSAIGVEVPNQQRQLVALGDLLGSEDARRATHPLEVAIGRDIAGRAVMISLAEMPHLLIAGSTGSGKSSCINSMLTSVLMRATPEQVRLILVDPKRVELGQYNGLPHLLTPVVVNPKRAANALAWAVHEMERRYDLLAEVGCRDISGYNAAWDRGELTGDEVLLPGEEAKTYHRLPFILVVVDELNDLMMVAARDVEESICRLAQMARAVGIHLLIATQRPSVDVITGVIKANVPSRLAFAVSSLADSRVILDQPGAERLVGKGDMLLLTASSNVPRRLQGPWVGEDEVRKAVAHWRRQSSPNYVEGVEGDTTGRAGGPGGIGGDDDDDGMVAQAMELIVRSQLGSTSMLQRKLRVGFARAGRIMDLLEQRGVVGPSEGSKPRAVLMTVEELDQTAGPGQGAPPPDGG